MSKRRLSSRNAVERSGFALREVLGARRRGSRWNGCAARANGRTWFFRIGAASFTNGSTALFASSSLRNGGRSASKVGPICCASVSTLPSVDAVWLSVPGSFDTSAEMFWSSSAKAPSVAFEPRTSRVMSLSLLPSSVIRRP